MDHILSESKNMGRIKLIQMESDRKKTNGMIINNQAVMRCGGRELRQLVCMTMKADENGMANSNASRMK
jgi:hypothetical protein